MPALPTIPEVIEIADVSVYLATNDNKAGDLYGKRLNSPKSPVEIAMSADALRWQYELNSTDTTLRGFANFVIWECGKYSLEAQNIITGSGGGTVIPSRGSRPEQLNFTVAASGTTLVDGQTTVNLPQFIGYNLLVNKNGTPLAQITSALVYYTWDKDTGVLIVAPAAATGDEFQITPA